MWSSRHSHDDPQATHPAKRDPTPTRLRQPGSRDDPTRTTPRARLTAPSVVVLGRAPKDTRSHHAHSSRGQSPRTPQLSATSPVIAYISCVPPRARSSPSRVAPTTTCSPHALSTLARPRHPGRRRAPFASPVRSRVWPQRPSGCQPITGLARFGPPIRTPSFSLGPRPVDSLTTTFQGTLLDVRDILVIRSPPLPSFISVSGR